MTEEAAEMDRRTFLAGAAASGIVANLAADGQAEMRKPLARRKLGKTGQRLSVIGFGGIVVVGQEQREADRIVAEAFERGVNYYDVAPSYGNGEAEEKLGIALAPHRKQAFLACKTTRRDRAGAAEELKTSLTRLRTDYFDLYQLHGLPNVAEAEKALAPGGAIETLVEARRSGVARYLGFSAHSVDAALMAIERFDFDTVLFPFNWVCMAQGNFGPQVLKAAVSRGMGCLALKALAYRPWPQGVKREYPNCWYQPIEDPDMASLALRYTLSEPVTSAIPPGDVRLFRLALSAADRITPLSADERRLVVARAEGVQPLFRHNAA